MILSALSIYLITAAIALFLTIAISMMLRRLFRPKGEPGGPEQTMTVAQVAPTATNPPAAAVAVATSFTSTGAVTVVPEVALTTIHPQEAAARGIVVASPSQEQRRFAWVATPPRGLLFRQGILHPHGPGILPRPPRRGPGPWKNGYSFH